jgi:hypothetical protein
MFGASTSAFPSGTIQQLSRISRPTHLSEGFHYIDLKSSAEAERFFGILSECSACVAVKMPNAAMLICISVQRPTAHDCTRI